MLGWILLSRRRRERVRRLPCRELRSHFGPVNVGLQRNLRRGELFDFRVHSVHGLPCGKLLFISRRFGLFVVRLLRSRRLFNGCRRKLHGYLCRLCSRHVLGDGRRLELFGLRELLDGLAAQQLKEWGP